MLAQGLAYHGPDGEIGDIMIVHHIEVHYVGSGGQYIVDFLAQAGEIGGEDGWGNQIWVHRGSLGVVNYRPLGNPASLSVCR